MYPEGAIRWWWVRHAQAAGVEGVYPPSTVDIAEVQEEEPWQKLRDTLPSAAMRLCSPLLRCVQTYERLFSHAPQHIEPAFAEQSFGQWEGRCYDDVWEETHHWPQWNSPEQLVPAGGESFLQLVERVGFAIQRLEQQLSEKDVIVIAHAGVIRAAHCVLRNIQPIDALAITVPHLGVMPLVRVL